MNHLVEIIGIVLVQLGFSYAIILAGTGNGSFVGLGAMLLALIGIPSTALINFLTLRSARNAPASSYAARITLISLILPTAQIALVILVSVFRL